MAATIHATLLSGRAVCLEVSLEITVNELRQLAQQSLGVGIGRLFTETGDLPETLSLQEAGLCSFAVVTCAVRRLQISSPWQSLCSLRSWPLFQDVSNPEAFAAVLPDGGVATWGFGAASDSSLVQMQLRDVRDVQPSALAFAALRHDGQVLTWGDQAYGGDCTEVQQQLHSVQEVRAASSAFAARRADGRVVTWGCSTAGGDSSSVQDRLRNVVALRASFMAFAAICKGGQVGLYESTVVIIVQSYDSSRY